jgi:hypothetical protein
LHPLGEIGASRPNLVSATAVLRHSGSARLATSLDGSKSGISKNKPNF